MSRAEYTDCEMNQAEDGLSGGRRRNVAKIAQASYHAGHMIINAFRKYQQLSGSIKTFIWTIVAMSAILIITTVWAFVRLETARTNIPSVPLQSLPPRSVKAP